MLAAVRPGVIAGLFAILTVLAATTGTAYADPPVPVASYSFDGGAARDTGGDHLDGIVRGASFTERGRFGDALDFDGTNDRVTIPDSFILDFEDGFTLEAWVRPDSLGTYASVLMRESSQAHFGYALYGTDSGGPSGITSDDLSNSTSIRGASEIPTDEWSHLALTYDGDDLKLYVDGDLVDSATSAVAPQDSDGDLQIGGNTTWGEYFDGTIDEVKLYNDALDDTEIEEDMTKPVEPAPRPDPVAAYAFDNGSARDTTLQHDAIVDGASYTEDGKFGDGLDFDGTDDKVSIPDDGALDLRAASRSKPGSIPTPSAPTHRADEGELGGELLLCPLRRRQRSPVGVRRGRVVELDESRGSIGARRRPVDAPGADVRRDPAEALCGR